MPQSPLFSYLTFPTASIVASTEWQFLHDTNISLVQYLRTLLCNAETLSAPTAPVNARLPNVLVHHGQEFVVNCI